MLASLRWLARHQNADGSWSAAVPCSKCAPNPGRADFDTGVTGLALLAFLGAGYTHLSQDTHGGLCFGDVVRTAIRRLQAQQDAEGCVGPRTAHKPMYNHALAALALAEADGMTGSALIRNEAQRAIDFLVAAQNPGRGWRYGARSGDNDTSVTGWAVMALKSAEMSGLTFPRSAYDGARAWLDEATDERGRAGYTSRGTGKVFIDGVNEDFNHHEALTAMAAASRLFIDRSRADPRVLGGVPLVVRDVPSWSGPEIDFYFWYCGALALQQAGEGRPWLTGLSELLLKHQTHGGCRDGSWEPVDRWSSEGGRVYATAINALTLEVNYRYPSVVR